MKIKSLQSKLFFVINGQETYNRYMNKFSLRRNAFIVFAVLVLILFAYMTYQTPLAGDDWGYALNGMKGDPLSQAFLFYKTWSGRFFSELWGFIVAPNKWLWNILNPLLFASIFIYIFLLTDRNKENGLLISLLIFTMMINVSGELRMETYSWIMGSTYVVPLALSLLYFVIVFRYYDFLKKMPLGLKIVSCLICFYIGLTMENIAAIMVFAQLLLIVYYYIENRNIPVFMIINTLMSLACFIIMRSSPGSVYRLLRDHAQFNSLPLLDKIFLNMPAFINYSFVEHKMTIGIFALGLCGLVFFKEKNRKLKWILIFHQFTAILLLFSTNIGSILHNGTISALNDENSLFIWIYWIIYIAIAFWIIIRNMELEERLKTLFFITIGGSCNLVMLVSPIFGARSSLYFVYFLIVATALIYAQFIRKGNILVIAVMLAFTGLNVLRIREYYNKYRLVSQINTERESIIEYYKDHPEEKEIYIPRMPIYSIHAGDIEEGDDYHFETFKAYYGLNPDAKVIFYWKDSY